MKQLEVNGIANLAALIYLYEETLPEKFKQDVQEQLDLLERYIVAIESGNVPFWHELKANKEQFPKRSSK